MNRIDAADADALLLLAFFGLCIAAGCVYLIAERITRKWPKGHGDSYFDKARRVSRE